MLEVFAPGKVAVITGAASGIGLAAAKKLAGTGMSVVMVDVDTERLPAAEAEVIAVAGGGDAVLPVICDVADADAMRALAADVATRFRAPSFLMNNAAIVHGGNVGVLDPLESWRRMFDVSLFGVLHGVAAFLPGMLEAGERAMVINTGSKQGLTHPPGSPAYNTVKAAVNAYTQNLAHDLRNRDGGLVSAHLLVPGWTTTGTAEHRPGAWLPGQVIEHMIERLREERFYIICPDDETTSETDRKRILWQALDIIEDRPALSRWHEDHKEAFAAFMARDLPKLG